MNALRNLFGKKKNPQSEVIEKKENPQNDSEPKIPMMEWCDIPSGNVTIITAGGEIETFNVTSFYMSKFPVTYAQFQAFIDAPDGFNNPEWWWYSYLKVSEEHRSSPGEQRWKINNHPRENVSWYDANAFCRWLSSKLGAYVYLPAEAARWWALQGGDKRTYPWGQIFNSSMCNTKESGIGQTTPVDRYPQGASPFGVMEMSGNVWELCRANDSNNTGSTTINNKALLMGGNWKLPAEAARVDTISWSDVETRKDSIGFRCARKK